MPDILRIAFATENANLQDPCGADYCGPQPFSEFETKALRDHILGLRRARSRQTRIQFYFSIHSYAQLWIFPHGYRNATLSSEDRRRLEILSRGAVKEISKLRGGYGEWKYGNITQLMGRTVLARARFFRQQTDSGDFVFFFLFFPWRSFLATLVGYASRLT